MHIFCLSIISRLVTKIKGAPLDKHLLNIEAVVNVRKQFMRRIKNQLVSSITSQLILCYLLAALC